MQSARSLKAESLSLKVGFLRVGVRLHSFLTNGHGERQHTDDGDDPENDNHGLLGV